MVTEDSSHSHLPNAHQQHTSADLTTPNYSKQSSVYSQNNHNLIAPFHSKQQSRVQSDHIKHASVQTNDIQHSFISSVQNITTTSAGQDDVPLRYRVAANDSLSDGARTMWEEVTEPNANRKRYSDPTPMWTRVTDNIYTYSAFWDSRKCLDPPGPVARVLGLLRYDKNQMEHKPGGGFTGVVKEGTLNSTCFLWYTGRGYREGVLRAFVYEEGLKVFVGTFFLCFPDLLSSSNSSSTVTARTNLIPYAVSLVSSANASTTVPPNMHRLIYLKTQQRALNNDDLSHTNNNSSAVCVRSLFGPYSDLKGITQFISYYSSVLNIRHFYLYDLAIDVMIRDFLVKLRGFGVFVYILPWNVPTSDWEELWDLGSLTALNDCIYRSSGLHHHVALVDIDEFIVPRTSVTDLAELYQKVLLYKHGTRGDAALIANAFYCYEFHNISSSENGNKSERSITKSLTSQHPKILMPQKKNDEDFPMFQLTRREVRLWPPRYRSKMVLMPEYVLSAGHHMVHHFLTKHMKNTASPKHVSVLHHYRECAHLRLGMFGKGKLVVECPTVIDKAAFRYKAKVLASPVVKLYQKLKSELV